MSNWDKFFKYFAIACVVGGFFFCWFAMQKACVH